MADELSNTFIFQNHRKILFDYKNLEKEHQNLKLEHEILKTNHNILNEKFKKAVEDIKELKHIITELELRPPDIGGQIYLEAKIRFEQEQVKIGK